jgi:hypothetical protein
MIPNERIHFGWVKINQWNSPVVEQATVYQLEGKRPIPLGSIAIKDLQENYGIVAHNSVIGSCKVGKSKIEEGLATAKNQAEAIFRELIPQLS